METIGKETLASIFNQVTDEETDEGLLLIQRHRIEDGWNRIENDWLLIAMGVYLADVNSHTGSTVQLKLRTCFSMQVSLMSRFTVISKELPTIRNRAD